MNRFEVSIIYHSADDVALDETNVIITEAKNAEDATKNALIFISETANIKSPAMRNFSISLKAIQIGEE
jgi:hypothetical protein